MNFDLFCFIKKLTRTIILILSLALLIPVDIWGQENDLISEHLRKTSYAIDSTAPAIILLSKGEASIIPSYGCKMKITRIVKILKKDAIDSWADIRENYSYAKITKIKAFTYNLEKGEVKKTEIEDDFIFKDKSKNNRKELRIGFSNVREGSIVEININITLLGNYYPSWVFQNVIPTIHSEFEISNFLDGEIKFDVTGKHPLHSHGEIKKGNGYQWTMKNIPAFVEEPLMPSPIKYFSLLRIKPNYYYEETWESVRMALLFKNRYGAIFETSYKLNYIADSILNQHKDTLAIIKASSNYVKNKVSWNGYDDIEAYPMDSILRNKSGSSGDINLLLLNLLHKCKIPVTTIFLATRDHVVLDIDKPELKNFNYVIGLAYVNGKPVLMDATDKFLQFDQIPEKCVNVRGIIITPDNYEWVNLTVNQKLKIVTSIDVKIDNDLDAFINVNISKYGYAASYGRKLFSRIGEDDYLKEFGTNKVWSLTSAEVLNADNNEKPIVQKYTIDGSDGFLTTQSQRILIDPFTFSRHTNLLTERERNYPIDFGISVEDIVIFNMNIPDGYEIESLPESKGLTLPNGEAKLLLNIVQNKSQLTITYSVQINRTFFEPVEYKGLFELFSRISALENELIILKKN